MDLLAISINHNTAPVELRESLHLTSDEIKSLLDELKNDVFKESFIISTCNRTEVYGIPSDKNRNYLDLEKHLLKIKPVDGLSDSHFDKFFSCSSLSHLFKVAAGLDSQMIGDNQILGQVKDSFQVAELNGNVGFLLKRVFDSAIKVGKRAKTETTISDGAITISYAAIQLIEKIFSNFSKKSALVIGIGETGELAAKHLRDKNIGKLAITNRTYEKAEKLAETLKASILPFNSFKEGMHNYDIIISATSSPSQIVSFEDVKLMMKKRFNSTSVIMDIAVPRDFDPLIKGIDNVFYNDIDSLNIIVEQNRKKRKDEIPKVRNIIIEEMISFFSWYNSLEIAPTIKSLRDLFEEIRFEEVSKQINRFNEADREKLEIVTKRIINKLLHKPITELKKSAEEGGVESIESMSQIGVLKDLFGINSERKN